VSVVPFESLVEASEPLHVLVLRERQGEQAVLASRMIEWRKVLVHGKLGIYSNVCVSSHGVHDMMCLSRHDNQHRYRVLGFMRAVYQFAMLFVFRYHDHQLCRWS
jgi:hypothetical protein